MKLKLVIALLLAVLSGCQAREPQTPEETGEMPYGKWDFAFFTPYALPAVVTRALIIDSEKVVSTFRTLDGIHENPKSIGSWSNRVRRHANFNKARHPPVLMWFCWDSIIDRKTYETRIIFQPSLREIMLTPTGKGSNGETGWYDTLLLGLAPEGKVRLWLQNSEIGRNMLIEPKEISTLSGDKLEACKQVPSSIDFNYSIPNGYDQDIKDFIKGKKYPYGSW